MVTKKEYAIKRKIILASLIASIVLLSSFLNMNIPGSFSTKSSTGAIIADQYVLNISTVLGTNGADPYAIATDSNGSIIVVGQAFGPINTKNAYNSTYSGNSDGFIAKFTQDGILVFSTYFGGNGTDTIFGVAVDNNTDSIYVVGTTESANFPTKNAYNATFDGNGIDDVFIAEFTSTGSLQFSTYFGGSSFDYGYGIAVDASGNAYITGYTDSTNLPMKNAWNSTYGGGSLYQDDAFVAKFNSTGQLIYSTYLGGSNTDDAFAIAVNATGTVYITGDTNSLNYPIIGGYQTVNVASNDIIFVSELDPNGTLVYSSLVGGTSMNEAYGIAVDSNGNYFITGHTSSSNFPTTSNAYNNTYNTHSNEAFLTEFNSTHNLVYSTFFGGAVNETYCSGIAIDLYDNMYITGYTTGSDLPMVNAINSTFGGKTDSFIAKFNSTGSLIFSTFLGGNDTDAIDAIAVDSYQEIYVTGYTFSTNFPMVNPYNSTIYNNDNTFFAKLTSPQITIPIPSTATSTTQETTPSSTTTNTTTSILTNSTGNTATTISQNQTSSSNRTSTISAPGFTNIPVLFGLAVIGFLIKSRKRKNI